MARLCVGGVTATLAVVAVVAVATMSADEDAITPVGVGVVGDRDGDASSTRRRHIRPLVYHVDENLPVGSLVGDLRTDLRSACVDRQQTDCDSLPTRFSMLHQRPAGSWLFDVHETTGVLRSAGEVDREKVCSRRETVCSVVLEVAVHYAAAAAFDVAVVEVSKSSSSPFVSVQSEAV